MIRTYNVIVWNFNRDSLEYYDIMPYLLREFKEDLDRKVFMPENKVPETQEDYKKFILNVSRHNFWARSQYEVIVSGWPKQKNEVKLDVFSQIKANIEVITNLFIENVNNLDN